ncbi:MAG: hypothetical protein KatS3mg066_2018 [Fischerella sp.]|nr:MAG: hypothetical protein KatS3mg066_2018 [Fischerella sp.]
MLSKEQRLRLEREKNSLEQVYELQRDKLIKIRQALVIETDPSHKFQYEQQIIQEENELQKLSDRLDEIENKIQSLESINIQDESKTIQQTKILILTAIPHGLRLDKEIREIEEAIRRASNRDLFEIRVRTAVRPQDIRRAIAEEQPEIVHFCGHGLKDGSLLLEDEGGNHKPVSAEALASLFKLHVNYVKCVLLNAWYSEKPAGAISQYIDYTIGMNKPIKDRAAIEFAKGFYDGLGYKLLGNQDVFQRAFDEAMVAIQMENLLEGSIPILWKRGITQKNPDIQIFQEDYPIPNTKSQTRVDTVTTIKADNWICIHTLTAHSNTVNSVAISPNGQTLVSASADKTIKIWNLITGRQIHTLEGHSDTVNSVAISPNGQTLVSASADKTIKIWNLHTGKQVRNLGGWFSVHLDSICSLAITPDGQTLISGSRDHTIKLWNLATGKQTGTLSQHSWGVYSLAITPDSQAIASDSLDHTIKLCLWDTEELLQSFLGHADWIWAIAISPNGKILASGSQDCTVKLWNLKTGELLHTLTDHHSPVHSVIFSWDGQILASGSYDNTIKLWSGENWQQIHTLTGHTNGVNAIAFSPNSRIIASASDDKTIKIWQR